MFSVPFTITVELDPFALLDNQFQLIQSTVLLLHSPHNTTFLLHTDSLHVSLIALGQLFCFTTTAGTTTITTIHTFTLIYNYNLFLVLSF
jgi:hypothetical protein